jgi:predicted Zn finger-like uncharacterized protein
MIVKCEQCKTRFRLADEKVPPSGVRVRCARCRHVFRVHRVSILRQPPYISPSSVQTSVQMASPPPVDEDPFSFFEEPMQQVGTSEPTRPGIFLPGVEASRREEESKASTKPPRVPVFGGSGGANISKWVAEKMATQAEEATQTEASSLLGVGQLQQTDAIRVEYLHPEQSEFQSPQALGTQKVPSFSTPSLRGLRENEELEGDLSLEDASTGPGKRVPQEFSAQEFFAQKSSAKEGGALTSLLLAASEDVVQGKDAGELRRANESEIRRAFVQSKTKVKRRKGLQRFLKAFALFVVAMFILSGGVIYWKEGKVFHRKLNGRVDWGKSFSWGRLKKNLFSEVAEKDMAGGLYAMHSANGEVVSCIEPTLPRG